MQSVLGKIPHDLKKMSIKFACIFTNQEMKKFNKTINIKIIIAVKNTVIVTLKMQ